MRNLVSDRPSLAQQLRDRVRFGGFAAEEARDLEDTELAFHKVWLARELRKLPTPRRRTVRLPSDAASGVASSIDGLRSACGLNPLPRRAPR